MTRRYQVVLFTACVAAMLAWSPTASAGHKYYVSPTGDDNADGTNPKKAWRTLNRVAMQTFVAKDRLLLEAGGVFHGSIQLSPDNSAGDIEIGTYNHGHAVIDAGNGPGIIISNLSKVKITSLEIRGSGQQSNTADGILIDSAVDPIPPNTIHYSDFVIDDIEVHDFKLFGILIHSHWGTGLNDARVTHVVSHDNGIEGITVLADEFPGTPNEDMYIGHCLAYHNHGTRGLPQHTGSGIVFGGVNRGTRSSTAKLMRMATSRMLSRPVVRSPSGPGIPNTSRSSSVKRIVSPPPTTRTAVATTSMAPRPIP